MTRLAQVSVMAQKVKQGGGESVRTEGLAMAVQLYSMLQGCATRTLSTLPPPSSLLFLLPTASSLLPTPSSLVPSPSLLRPPFMILHPSPPFSFPALLHPLHAHPSLSSLKASTFLHPHTAGRMQFGRLRHAAADWAIELSPSHFARARLMKGEVSTCPPPASSSTLLASSSRLPSLREDDDGRVPCLLLLPHPLRPYSLLPSLTYTLYWWSR